MNILIVGGAGYIGSHMVKYLLAQGHNPIVLDDFSTGFEELLLNTPCYHGCLSNQSLLDLLFSRHAIKAVMHFAALSQIKESYAFPNKCYENNVAKTIVLLNSMLKYQIKYFIFSSSAAIFGNPAYTPIDEAHPQMPVNPYGKSKLMIESILADYHAAFNLNYCSIRYFNAAGADPESKIGECHNPETHLIPTILDVAIGKRDALTINGNDYNTPDGTCIRDYIHVCDIAQAHSLALDFIMAQNTSITFNLGNSQGYSVIEVIKSAEKVTGKIIPQQYGPRRIGDPAILIANSEYIQKTLGWKPQFPLIDTIVTHAWNWTQKINKAAVKPIISKK